MSELTVEIQKGNKIEDMTQDQINIFAERLDFLDIQILRKFYMTGKEFPFDSQPFCFPILYRDMKVNLHLKIGMEALRKRLDNLVKIGLIEKIRHSNPVVYSPAAKKSAFIRATITKFFLINGLSKFL